MASAQALVLGQVLPPQGSGRESQALGVVWGGAPTQITRVPGPGALLVGSVPCRPAALGSAQPDLGPAEMKGSREQGVTRGGPAEAARGRRGKGGRGREGRCPEVVGQV